MRFVFIDEAGTSLHEPVTVVVGLVAHADEHVIIAENAIAEVVGAVPRQFRSTFSFHATEVLQSRKYQNAGWSLTDRINLLCQMMSLPRRVGMGIIVAAHWRESVDFAESYGSIGLTASQSDHFHAFTLCLEVADRGIRKYADPREVAVVVAEDVPDMRKYLKLLPSLLRDNPVNISQSMLRQTASDKEAGYCLQSGDMRVSRLRNSIHFVEKKDEPLIWLADACAFGIRRYFANEKFGRDFVRAVLGDDRMLRNFQSPGGVEGFWKP